MGGKGSGRPRGPDKERIQVVYQYKKKRHCFTVYMPPEDYDLIEEYCEAKGWYRGTYVKRLIEKYLTENQPQTIGLIFPYGIRYGCRDKEMSSFLYKIMEGELEKDADFQKYKKEYQEVI